MYVGLASPTETCVGSELAKVQGVLEIESREANHKGRDEIDRDPYGNLSKIRYGDQGRNEIDFELYVNEKSGHLEK
jgi:hypothetical protein